MTTILTPEQENELVTKGFLKQELKNLEDRAFKTFTSRKELDGILENLATKDDMLQWKSEIINSVDKLTKSFKDHEQEHTDNLSAHDRFEKRISALEGKPIEAVEIA